MSGSLTLAAYLLEHLVLTALPMAAAALFAARRGVRQVPVLLAIALAASGAVAMLAFWAYYGDPLLGESFGYLAVLGSATLIAWCLYDRRSDLALLRPLLTPFWLWALGSVFLLCLGFVHGGVDEPLATSSTRFSPPLPVDNYLPLSFAEWFFQNGHDGPPPVVPGDWLSSDRPPLQMGYVLSQRAFGWGDDVELHYEVLGILLQQLWIVGLWALLLAAGVGRVTRALTMLTVLASNVAILNGFFVWPKMLPTAMLLAVAALVATPLWAQIRRSPWGAALVAALIGFALLGHGASVFGVIPLLLVVAYRGFPTRRWIGVGLLVGLMVLVPWSAYQKYGDPPGNRLTKWFLAGAEKVDDRGALEAIADSYGEVGLGGTIDNKVENFVTMAGGEPMANDLEAAVDAVGDGDLAEFASRIRVIFFFNLLPSMGLLLFAPFAVVAAWRRRSLRPAEWSFALTCLAIFLSGAVAWGLIMFGPPAARTTIHVGSYLLPVLGLCGLAVGLRAALPRFAIAFLGVNAVAMLVLYGPALDPPEGSAYSLPIALLTLASLSGFLVVSLRAGRPSPSPQPSA